MLLRTSLLRLARPGVVALVGLTVGCTDLSLSPRKPPPEPVAQAESKRDPILMDTVGERVFLGASAPLRLRGFGLVIGLGENGSADCPTALRSYLSEYLRKELMEDGPNRVRSGLSIDGMIDSLDTAVVELTALVPPGAPKGTVVDVQVEAVSGSSTRSLVGGMLVQSELKLFAPDATGRGIVAGRAIAKARGPVFVNPFGSEDRRRGSVLGGGLTLEERPLRLLLSEPSYPMARRIESRINERFGQRPRTADARSAGMVELRTPAAFANDPERFRDVAMHLLMRSEQAFVEQRLTEISTELDGVESIRHAAAIWEAVGRSVVSRLQPLYNSKDDVTRFYAAQAGLRLKDSAALAVLTQFALTGRSDLRLLAIRELEECDFSACAPRLLPLLDDSDPQVRIGAYEVLRAHRHPAVQTRSFGTALDPRQLNLALDVVPSSGRPLIYVCRSREPRIVVFGTNMSVEMPLFHALPDDQVLLSGDERGREVRVAFRSPLPGLTGDTITCSPRVADLIAAVAAPPQKLGADVPRGAGLAYSQVAGMLAALVREGALSATIEFERAPLAELLGPSPDRPDTDESPAFEGQPVLPSRQPAEGGRSDS